MIGKFKDWFKDDYTDSIKALEERVEELEDSVSDLKEEIDSLYEKGFSLRDKIASIEMRNNILISICIVTSIAAIAVAFLK